MQNQDRVISKDELIEAVWQQVAVTDDALTQTIKDIRRAIGDADTTILKSYPKRGYLFSASSAPEPAMPMVIEADPVLPPSEHDEDTSSAARPPASVQRRERLTAASTISAAWKPSLTPRLAPRSFGDS